MTFGIPTIVPSLGLDFRFCDCWLVYVAGKKPINVLQIAQTCC